MDLTKIEKPFGLLDGETRAALQAHGGPYEIYFSDGWKEGCPLWMSDRVYRAKPKPLTKPSIDWSHVAPEYNYLATDKGGGSYLHGSEPVAIGDFWDARLFCSTIRASAFASFRPGTCDWRDSLVKRPDEGDEK